MKALFIGLEHRPERTNRENYTVFSRDSPPGKGNRKYKCIFVFSIKGLDMFEGNKVQLAWLDWE